MGEWFQNRPRELEFWEKPRLGSGYSDVEVFLTDLFSRSPDTTAPLFRENQENRVVLSKIRNGIYLGSEIDIRGDEQRKIFQEHGITAILDVRSESKGQPEVWYSVVDLDSGEHAMEYKWIGIDEPLSEVEAKSEKIPPLETHFDEAFEFIERRRQNGEAVLVHCAMGVCRSPSIVIAFLMRSEGLSFKEAFLEVHRKRNIVRPNDYFLQQLLQYESVLREQGLIKPSKAKC